MVVPQRIHLYLPAKVFFLNYRPPSCLLRRLALSCDLNVEWSCDWPRFLFWKGCKSVSSICSSDKFSDGQPRGRVQGILTDNATHTVVFDTQELPGEGWRRLTCVFIFLQFWVELNYWGTFIILIMGWGLASSSPRHTQKWHPLIAPTPAPPPPAKSSPTISYNSLPSKRNNKKCSIKTILVFFHHITIFAKL